MNNETEFVYVNPYPSVPKTEQVVGHKIGRNSPCYCGSLKKYKKCCELKDFEQGKKQAAEEDAELQAWLEQDFIEGQRLLEESKA